eukprot:1199948-Alexandrium_andersonii.AAC.1
MCRWAGWEGAEAPVHIRVQTCTGVATLAEARLRPIRGFATVPTPDGGQWAFGEWASSGSAL